MILIFLLLFILFMAMGGACVYFLNKVFIAMKKDDNKAERDDEIQDEYHRRLKDEIRHMY